MIEVDTLYKRSDNNIISIFKIIKNRLATEDLTPEVRGLFIINHDILKQEIEKRGLSINE